MAFTPISTLPTVPTRSMTQAIFTTTADAFLAALPGFVTQANQLGTDANANAASAASSAGIAGTAATNAAISETNALASKNAAAAFAASATNAANVAGTSNTSNTVPATITGSKSFTYVETNRVPSVGQYLLCADTAAPTANNIVIQVTAWNSGTQVVTGDVVDFKGSGTKAAWTISLTGKPGATGAAGAAGVISLGRKTITGTDTLVAADLGKLVRCTSAVAADFTVTLDAAATLGANWFVTFSNESQFTCTLASASIDGATSKTVPPGNSIFIECNGSDVVTQPLKTAHALGAIGAALVVNAAAAGTITSFVQLTATTGLAVYSAGAGINMVVLTLNPATGALSAGTAVALTAAGGGVGGIRLLKLDATHAAVLYAPASGSLCLGYITIAGTVPSVPAFSAVATGPHILVYNATAIVGAPDLVNIDGTKFLAFFVTGAGNLQCQVITLTAGSFDASAATVQVDSNGVSYSIRSACRIGGAAANKALVAGLAGGSANIALVSFTGTTPSLVLTTNLASGYGNADVLELATGEVLYRGSDSIFASSNKADRSTAQIISYASSLLTMSPVSQITSDSSCGQQSNIALTSGRVFSSSGANAGQRATVMQRNAGSTFDFAAAKATGTYSGSSSTRVPCAQFDANWVVVLYADSLNSSFLTARAVNLGTLAG